MVKRYRLMRLAKPSGGRGFFNRRVAGHAEETKEELGWRSRAAGPASWRGVNSYIEHIIDRQDALGVMSCLSTLSMAGVVPSQAKFP